MGFDGYDYVGKRMTLNDVINDPRLKMGHAFVLAMLLTVWCRETLSNEMSPRFSSTNCEHYSFLLSYVSVSRGMILHRIWLTMAFPRCRISCAGPQRKNCAMHWQSPAWSASGTLNSTLYL